MKPELVELSRAEVARLAGVLDPLIERHGTQRRTAKAIGLGESAVSKIARRLASVSVERRGLEALARAAGAQLEDILPRLRTP